MYIHLYIHSNVTMCILIRTYALQLSHRKENRVHAFFKQLFFFLEGFDMGEHQCTSLSVGMLQSLNQSAFSWAKKLVTEASNKMDHGKT